jgi:hypothetical protein
MWLCQKQSLFAERRKELGFPQARVKIDWLAVARPIPIRSGQSQLELLERPSRRDMRCESQYLEDVAWLALTKIIKRGTRWSAQR